MSKIDKYLLEKKYCAYCGKEMQFKSRKYCNVDCREAAWLEKVQKCHCCGKEFHYRCSRNMCQECATENARQRTIKAKENSKKRMERLYGNI